MRAGISNWNAANVLTVIRILLVPIMGWMLLAHPDDFDWRLATTLVFAVAVLTDFIDGQIARRCNLVTDFGKLWDPVADKALTGMAFIGLSIIGELHWAITVVILVREWGITALRASIVKYGVMAANGGGKLKTVVQCGALVLFLPGLKYLPVPIWWFAWVMMFAALCLTVVTGFTYLLEAAKLRRAALDRWAREGRPE